MAIKRRVTYDIQVTGAARAAGEIGDLDNAADGATGALRGSGRAASAAAKSYAAAEAEARSLGKSFDQANDKAAKLGGRFGDVRSRLGELEDAFFVLSGFALLEMGQTLIETAKTLYAFTEAGRTAQQQTEALAEAVSALQAEFNQLDPSKAAGLGAAMAEAGAAAKEYERRLQSLVKKQVELNKAREHLQKLETQGKVDTYDYRNTARNIGILTREVEASTIWTNEARAATENYQTALETVRAEVENQRAARNRMIGALGTEAATWAKNTAALAVHRIELQKNGLVLTGHIDILARLGAAGVEVYEGIAAAVAKSSATTSKAVKKQVEELVEATRSFDEVGADHAAGFHKAREAYDAWIETVTSPEAVSRSMHEVGADMAAAFQAGLAEQHASAEAGLQTLLQTNSAIRAGAEAWSTWEDHAIGAIDAVSSVLGSVRVAMDAIVDRDLTVRRNAVASAQAQLQSAKTAEERAAAEEKVYRAQLQLQKAEEDAAKARQRMKVIEFALEGAKMAAKSIEAAALASMLLALPFGVGAPFVPAAIAASATYGVAAAAYGVAAGVTASAPTAQGAPPQRPGDDLAGSTVAAGDRNRSSGGTTVNMNFAGQPFETRHDIHDAMIQGMNVASQRRGRARANFAALQRHGRGSR